MQVIDDISLGSLSGCNTSFGINLNNPNNEGEINWVCSYLMLKDFHLFFYSALNHVAHTAAKFLTHQGVLSPEVQKLDGEEFRVPPHTSLALPLAWRRSELWAGCFVQLHSKQYLLSGALSCPSCQLKDAKLIRCHYGLAKKYAIVLPSAKSDGLTVAGAQEKDLCHHWWNILAMLKLLYSTCFCLAFSFFYC